MKILVIDGQGGGIGRQLVTAIKNNCKDVEITAIGTNLAVADQYLAIVIPGSMYKDAFKKQGLDAKNLSRALEDSATITSSLIPWNTCGAYMSATLGVGCFAFLPFAFFNLLCPIISLIYGATGITIEKIKDDENAEIVV